MQFVCLGGLFPEGPCVGYPSLQGLFSGPLEESRCAPKIKGDSCPFCVTSPWEGLTKIYLHLSSGNYLMVVYTLETFVSMYPIPMLGYIRYCYSP